jgi:hypothetical protein
LLNEFKKKLQDAIALPLFREVPALLILNEILGDWLSFLDDLDNKTEDEVNVFVVEKFTLLSQSMVNIANLIDQASSILKGNLRRRGIINAVLMTLFGALLRRLWQSRFAK